MENDAPKFARLLSLWEGDGNAIREQLIYSGLLLMIFERFKKYVIGQVDGFFADEIEICGGDLKYKRGEKFKRLIKEKGDKGDKKPGKHNNKDFRGAMYWFYDLGAVTQDEFDDVEHLFSRRNDIGHELLQIIADDTKTQITLMDVLLVFDVYVKVVRWWIKEVEATTDPDFDPEKYENTDWSSVESTDTIILRQIMHKALAGIPLWESLKSVVEEEAGPTP